MRLQTGNWLQVCLKVVGISRAASISVQPDSPLSPSPPFCRGILFSGQKRLQTGHQALEGEVPNWMHRDSCTEPAALPLTPTFTQIIYKLGASEEIVPNVWGEALGLHLTLPLMPCDIRLGSWLPQTSMFSCDKMGLFGDDCLLKTGRVLYRTLCQIWGLYTIAMGTKWGQVLELGRVGIDPRFDHTFKAMGMACPLVCQAVNFTHSQTFAFYWSVLGFIYSCSKQNCMCQALC